MFRLTYAVLGLAGMGLLSAADPLEAVLGPVLRPTSVTMIERFRAQRRYDIAAFPLDAARFGAFRDEVVKGLAASLDLAGWVPRPARGKFLDTVLRTIRHHGVEMEIHQIELLETGDRIPAVVCLPASGGKRPAVAVFSGHGKSGLRDLVVDLESYQAGIATRLAQAGFVTIAVEKLDTGYLSRNPPAGVDENAIATFRLGTNTPTRSVQLMASLAAIEILARHPRVDPTRIGATGVSLGGWLAIQTALLSDRIAAVADFGRKTVMVPDDVPAASFEGVADLCHVLPGMFALGDRNLFTLAYAPRPLLAGHGRADNGSHQQADRYFRQPLQRQYEILGARGEFQYESHGGGDVMPAEIVIRYFRERFE